MSNKQAVVTGGTGALGQAVVEKLLQDGFEVHVSWLFERELDNFKLRDQVSLHKVDCQDEKQVSGLYQQLDQLAASAHIVGGFAMASLADLTASDFAKMYQLNMLTTFLCCQQAVIAMRRANAEDARCRRIVNVSARPALTPGGGMLAYSSAKAAVASFTQCCADEVIQENILINAIAPSIMDTPQNRSDMPGADFSTWPKTQQVAGTIAYLLGDANQLTSGNIVPVYGRA